MSPDPNTSGTAHEPQSAPAPSAADSPTLTVPPRALESPQPATSEMPAPRVPSDVLRVLAPAERPDELGRLGRYRVLRVLGRGGMGVVFAAEDEKLKRVVALKAMLSHLANDETSRGRFVHEAAAAAKVEHDYIVPIYDIAESNNIPFIAMPLLVGQTLADRLKAGALPVPELLTIGRHIAEGLTAAHAVDLVHRDIKPGNIWLEARAGTRPAVEVVQTHGGTELSLSAPVPLPADDESAYAVREPSQGEFRRARILDFGLARSFHGDTGVFTQSGAVVGTPAYMAPEQACGGAVDHRADLFSLGCVLYHAATGRRPFRGENALAVFSALANDTPTPPAALNPAVPPALSELIARLLTKNPDDRWPATAQAVADELARIAALVEQRATAPPAPKRRRWLAPALGAAGLCVLAALAYGVARNPTRETALAPAPQSENPPPKSDGPKAEPPKEAPKPVPPVEPKGGVIVPPRSVLVTITAEQRKTLQWILDIGGGFETQRPDWRGWAVKEQGGKVPDDQPLELVNVAVDVRAFTDADLSKLAVLPPIRDGLRLDGSGVTNEGLKLIPTLPNLAGVGQISLAATDVNKEGVEQLARALPGCRIVWSGGAIPPKTRLDPEVRNAVAWVLKHGGKVRVETSGKSLALQKVEDLDGRINPLLHIDLPSDTEDYALREVEYVTKCEMLSARDCPLTDGGLDMLCSYPGFASTLAHLDLSGTKITSAGLVHLKRLKALTRVTLQNTGVTKADAEALAKSLPKCRIEYPGGTIEPK